MKLLIRKFLSDFLIDSNFSRDFEHGTSWQKEVNVRDSIYRTMEYIRPERPSAALDTFVIKGRGSESVSNSRASSPVNPPLTPRITRVSTAPLNRRTTRVRPSTADGYGKQTSHVNRQTAFAAHAARILENLSDSD